MCIVFYKTLLTSGLNHKLNSNRATPAIVFTVLKSYYSVVILDSNLSLGDLLYQIVITGKLKVTLI